MIILQKFRWTVKISGTANSFILLYNFLTVIGSTKQKPNFMTFLITIFSCTGAFLYAHYSFLLISIRFLILPLRGGGVVGLKNFTALRGGGLWGSAVRKRYPLLQCHIHSHQEVTKRCHLFWWPIAPICSGGGELWGLSQWAQLYTGAQINFRDLTRYLTYDSHR